MKKAEIIEELSKAEWLTKATKNIAKGNELARELYQFYFLTILQKPDEQIEKIYNVNKSIVNLVEVEEKWYGFSQYFKQNYAKYFAV